jgi:hypothetical protein
VTTRVQASVGISVMTNHDDTQWFGNFDDRAATHFTFAHVDQISRSLTVRASYAATPNLSLVVYAEPFTSDGVYANVRELSATPLAAAYTDRFSSYTAPAGTPAQFAVRQLRATSVLRWEFKRGSSLYVVLAHDRDAASGAESGSWERSARELFALQPINTILVKASYWLTW